jgi:hypothetical protein
MGCVEASGGLEGLFHLLQDWSILPMMQLGAQGLPSQSCRSSRRGEYRFKEVSYHETACCSSLDDTRRAFF